MWYVIAGILGVLCGLLVPYNLSSAHVPYVAVAIIAALDSICGALLANLNKKFNMNVLVTGLISNAILAVLFTYLGNLLGIELYFVIMIVFGVRIFNNVAAIRRITADIYFHTKAREKEQLRRRALKAADGAADIPIEETDDAAEKKETETQEKSTKKAEDKAVEEAENKTTVETAKKRD